MVTVVIKISAHAGPMVFNEIDNLVGGTRLYRKGTDPDLFADYIYREGADLTVVNLNLIPGVKASIREDTYARSLHAGEGAHT